MNFYNLKVGTRITLGFFTLVILTVFTGALALFQLSNVAATASALATVIVPGIEAAAGIRDSLTEIRHTEAEHLIAATPEAKAVHAARLKKLQGYLVDAEKTHADRFGAELTREKFESFKKNRAAWYESLSSVLALSNQGLGGAADVHHK